MVKGGFRPIFLVVILFPLLGAFLGYLLTATTQNDSAQVVSSIDEEPVMMQGPSPISEPQTKELSLIELTFYLALLCGIVALVYHYLASPLAWIAIIILPLIFSSIYLERTGMSLTLFYLPTLALSVLIALLIKFLFFNKKILPFRLILCTLLGAGIITVYLYSLYLLTSTPFTNSDGFAFFWTSLILLVFVFFGISLADMLIMRYQNRRIKSKQPEIEEYNNQND
ncbi:MAG: hypothetical protein WC179_03175 [Candidatus Cloacimonadaceae bacterium]|jgi:cation transport ATPase|nr:hypothetical protein [Candidatus Cloacimonadota bacterium]MCB5258008.1 hypothetical protein [Candidatus Cloacimonadota bacterium]MDY0112508.1 hypothetical protein [Candidatus Syntrophosphaera sp.]